MKKFGIFTAALVTVAIVAVTFVSVFAKDNGGQVGFSQAQNASATQTGLTVSEIIDTADMFTDRDIDYSYDSAVEITLADSGSKADSNSVEISGDTVTVRESGVYVFSGELTDGQIIVDADDDAKVQLVLNNVTVNCDNSAAIYVKNAKKVFVTSLGENTLTNKSEFVNEDDENINAVIYAKDDLTLNGDGKLTVTAVYGNGVHAKDDLKICGGEYNITGAKHAIKVSDSLRVHSGKITLTSHEKDGIHCENGEDETKGYVYIQGGELTVNAADDGIHAENLLKIDGGTVTVAQSSEGLEARLIDITGGDISVTAQDDGMNAASSSDDEKTDNNGFGGGMMDSDDSCAITISGGKLTVNANGDGIDSNGFITVSGGDIVVFGPTINGNAALDYGIRAEISGGTFIALGTSGMAESFADTSKQASILYSLGTSGSEGDTVTLTDKNGSELVSVTAEKQFDCVLVSAPELTSDGTYTLSVGGSDYTVEMNGIVYSNVQNRMGF